MRKDLFKQAQENSDAPYQAVVITFPKTPKPLDKETYNKRYMAMLNTFKLMTDSILEMEQNLGNKILLRNNQTFLNKSLSPATSYTFFTNNPCISDNNEFAFYINKDFMSKKQILKLFCECSKKCNNYYEYVFGMANFETTIFKECPFKLYVSNVLDDLFDGKNCEMISVDSLSQDMCR